MKTLPIILFLAALGAFLFSLVSFELSVSLLLISGIASILGFDYRARRPRVAGVSAQARRKATSLPLAV